MTEFRTFQSGEILSDTERAKLSPADRKSYDLEQKIRGLMSRADDPRTPQAERETATRMIAKLITKHQIDLALLRQKELGANGPVRIVSFEVWVSNRFGIGNVRSEAISRAVISPMGGTAIWFHSAKHAASHDTRIKIFLPEDVVGTAKMLIASLTLQMETGLKVAGVQHLRELRWEWVPQSEEKRLMSLFRKGYLMAWGETVGRRVNAGREDARQEASRETGKEIALLDTSKLVASAVDLWNEQRGAKPRAARKVLVSETGTTAGRKDGRRAQLAINEIGGKSAVRAIG